jgi:phage shock protein PspC (stress-responsive transcriptional regulator)
MTEQNWLQRFTKSEKDCWIGGICGGLGESTAIPSWAWRFLFTLLSFIWGIGIIIYILLWIFVPKKKVEMDS